MPVPKKHIDNLTLFALWLFGTEDKKPLVTDSRRVDDFGKILENKESVQYLRETPEPRFDVAFEIAGGGEAEVERLIVEASNLIELSLTAAHRHRNSTKVQKAVRRFGEDAYQLLRIFPNVKDELENE